MKRIVAIMLLLVLVLTGCDSNAPTTETTKIAEDAMIAVGNKSIDKATFEVYFKMYVEAYKRYLGDNILTETHDGVRFVDTLKANIVELLTNDLVVKSYVSGTGYTPDATMVDEKLQELNKELDENTKALYESIGATQEFLREQVEGSYYVEEFQRLIREDITANEEKLNELFAQEVATVKVKHILVETLEKIQEVQRKLQAGEEWDKLAAEYSTDSSNKDKGGDLGYVYRGTLDPSFEQVAFSAPLNTVSEPFLSSFGYHLVIVEDSKTLLTLIQENESPAVIDSLKESTIGTLVIKAYDDKLAELKQSAEIVVKMEEIDKLIDEYTGKE